MGGYNTFCEILSLDKRALIVPRTPPRLEQHIRAVEAERLGLVRMLTRPDGGARDPRAMAQALRAPAEPAAALGGDGPGPARRARRIRERFAAALDATAGRRRLCSQAAE